MTLNHSLQTKRYSRLRPLPRSGELKRWADGNERVVQGLVMADPEDQNALYR